MLQRTDRYWQRRGVSVLFFAATLAGCGGRNLPEIGTVSGVVTLDGQPVKAAVVTFQPEIGRPSRGKTADDGTFELSYLGGEKGALVGSHRVTISTQWMDEDPKTHVIVSHPETLPAKYNAKSDLKRVVEAGRNQMDFPLTSK